MLSGYNRQGGFRNGRPGGSPPSPYNNRQARQMPPQMRQQGPTAPGGFNNQGNQGNQGQRRPTPQEMGITFEPVESLFGGAPAATPALPGGAPGETPLPVAPSPVVGFNDADVKLIGDFVQNERNAALFYDHLSAISRDANGQTLSEIADFCRKSSQAFGNIYKNRTGQDYEIRQTQIDTTANLRGGLRWAIREEGLALLDMAALMEKIPNNPELTSALYRKIACLGSLMGMV